MLRAVIQLIHRELLMALRQRSDILNPLWFFLIVICPWYHLGGRLAGGHALARAAVSG